MNHRKNSITKIISGMFSIAFFLVLACSSNNENEIQNIESDILVSVSKENLNVRITATTERIYPSTGFSIGLSKEIKSNQIFVKFTHIEVPEGIVHDTLWPAVGIFDLGNLKDGEYDITFELNGKNTSGKLKIGSNLDLILDSVSNVRAY